MKFPPSLLFYIPKSLIRAVAIHAARLVMPRRTTLHTTILRLLVDNHRGAQRR